MPMDEEMDEERVKEGRKLPSGGVGHGRGRGGGENPRRREKRVPDRRGRPQAGSDAGEGAGRSSAGAGSGWLRAVARVLLVGVLAWGCGGGEPVGPGEEGVRGGEARQEAAGAAGTLHKPGGLQEETEQEEGQQEAVEDGMPRVVFLGDSLTAGFGLAEAQAFPARVEELLEARGMEVEVVNAGVSGDTSAGGLARLDWLLSQKPDVVVVGLGANDGLRGLAPEETEGNLRAIVRGVREAGAEVVLLGMKIPPNYGPEYTQAFEEVYPRVAEDLGVPLVPFLLEGVGGEVELNLPDGIHPNAEGHRRVAENVAPVLAEVLGKGDGRR